MEVAVLGATGRTGRLVVGELLARGHDVRALVRDPAVAGLPDAVDVRVGDARDVDALRGLVAGADAVVSALGPRRGDATLHREVAARLVDLLPAAGVRRFVGISGAGIAVPGDRKSVRDRVISALIRGLGGAAVRDKADEHQRWAATDLDWTLVRAPRLLDGAASGRVEHDAHRSPKRTSLTRADLAAFVVDCVEGGAYPRAAPLVAAA